MTSETFFERRRKKHPFQTEKITDPMPENGDINWEAYIVTDARVLAGKPVVKGTRLAVAFILELMARGWSEQDLLENYPTLSREGIRACLWYAGQVIGYEHVFPAT